MHSAVILDWRSIIETDSMLRKLIQRMKALSRDLEHVDPVRFNDPVARKTEWTPLKRGGSNFCTHKLVEISSRRIEFHASAGAKVFSLVFLIMGLVFCSAFLIELKDKGSLAFDIENTLGILFGLFFASIGGGMYYSFTIPMVFDKKTGIFWKGRKNPRQVYRKKKIKAITRIENVHALQLISEYCRGSKRSYRSYELNLVLEDGSRLNVIDHGNLKKIREDAETLSKFLNKPIWDAI